ncbi:hypothetical protein BZG36_03257, partial [Bifiguratus adelaidae]
MTVVQTGMLKTQGMRIIDSITGQPVILRGVGLGGWMNMENFISGFVGREFQMRESLLQVLGQEKYDFFFD